MKNVYRFLTVMSVFTFLAASAIGNEIMVNTFDGDMFVLQVDPHESLSEIEEKVVALADGKRKPFVIECAGDAIPGKRGSFKAARNQGGYLGYPRNYHLELSREEKADIRFIVTFLANKSLLTIGLAKPDLEAAGDRIEHIHPLRFLMTVFTDEELKVGIRNIRGRGWVWNHFVGGFRDSLTTEMGIDNMKREYIHDFAQNVKIAPEIIIPAVSNQNWDNFIDLLITHIPRVGDHDRFDN